jgi:ferric-dicitrate binding protein FerR (iron transport regulator)
MKREVTRDVVGDLWPLCQSGDASADSRALVEEYLARDEEFAKTMRAGDRLPRLAPQLRLSPDAERRLLDEARDRARRKLIVTGMIVGVAGILLLAAFAGAFYLVVVRAG